jgi:signal transduction histidine kinase
MRNLVLHLFTLINKKPIAVVVGLLLISFQPINAQESKRIDSLKENVKDRSTKGYRLAESTHLFIELSTAYAGVNQDSLFHYANQALKLASTNQDLHSESILALRNLGFYYSEKGDNKKALNFYNQAEIRCLQENLPHHQADLLRLKGDEYYFLGDFENSLASLLAAIEISKEFNSDNYLMLSIAYRNIGRLYSAHQDYTSALEFHWKAVEANKALQNEQVSSITFAQLADIYNQIGDVEKAKEHVLNSLRYFERENQVRWLTYCQRILGDTYRLEGKYGRAIHWLEQALNNHDLLDDQREKSKILLSLARSHLGKSDPQNAEKRVLQAQVVSTQIQDIQIQKELAEVLYKVSEAQGKLSRALAYHRQFKALNDSLFAVNNNRSLSLYKGELQFQKEKEQLVYEAEKKVAQSRNLLIGSLVVVAVLFGLIIPLFLKERKLRQLIQELAYKTNFLQKKEAQLRSANESKNVIFSILGHDLKSPISTLHNALELYSDNIISKEELLKNLPSLKSGVNQILLTLNNLLFWSSGQLKGAHRQASSFSIRSIVEQNIEFLKETARLKGLEVNNEIPPQYTVLADRNQISLIVRNLLDNAIKYTPVNGKAIRFEAHRVGDCIETRVIDFGVGMDKEKLKKINANGQFFSTTGTNKEKGTGLGIELCKEMIAVNDGQIFFKSTPGEGSVISFCLPSSKKAFDLQAYNEKAAIGAV